MYFLSFFFVFLLKTNSKRKSNFDVRPEINCLNKETLFFISICFMGSWVLIKHLCRNRRYILVSFSAQKRRYRYFAWFSEIMNQIVNFGFTTKEKLSKSNSKVFFYVFVLEIAFMKVSVLLFTFLNVLHLIFTNWWKYTDTFLTIETVAFIYWRKMGYT